MPDTAGARTPPRPPEFATPSEAAAYTRLSIRTLRRAVADGRLPAYRVGGRPRFRYRDLSHFVGSGGAAAAPPSYNLQDSGPAPPPYNLQESGPATPDPHASLEEAAAYCGMARAALLRAARGGALAMLRIGPRLAFRFEDLDAFLDRQNPADAT